MTGNIVQFTKLVELLEAKAWQGKDATTGKQFHYLEGYASNLSLDRDGDRMSINALKSMMKDIENGMNLFLDHEHNLSNTLGIITKGEVRGDRLWVQARLEDPTVNSNVKSLLNKMETGVKVGLSIGGDMLKHHFEEDRGLNKRVRVIDDVALYEISAVGLPSNQDAFVYGSMFKRKRLTEAEYKHVIRNNLVDECSKILGTTDFSKLLQGADAGQHPDQQGQAIHSHVHSHPPGQGHTEPLNHAHSHPIGTPHPSPVDHAGAVDMDAQGGDQAHAHEEGGPGAVGMPGAVMNEDPYSMRPGAAMGVKSFNELPQVVQKTLINIAKKEWVSKPMGGYANFSACTQANQDKGSPDAYCGHIYHQTHGKNFVFVDKIHKTIYVAKLIKQDGAADSLTSTDPATHDWTYAESLDNWDGGETKPPEESQSERDRDRYGMPFEDAVDPNEVDSPEWIDLSFRTRKSKSSPKGRGRGQISPTLKGAQTPSGKM